MATVTIADLTALAENLTAATADAKETAKHLKQRIEAEGLKIGAQISKNHAKAAEEQIAKVTEAAKFEIQSRDDVIKELRRQLEVQERMAGEGREAKARLTAVRLCKVWRDNLGRGYVFTDELAHAINPDIHPAPVPVRLDKEN
jgi:cell division protein FtsX